MCVWAGEGEGILTYREIFREIYREIFREIYKEIFRDIFKEISRDVSSHQFFTVVFYLCVCMGGGGRGGILTFQAQVTSMLCNVISNYPCIVSTAL